MALTGSQAMVANGVMSNLSTVLDGSKSSGGSVNSSYGVSKNVSDSKSNVFGTAASLKAKVAAAEANASARDAWENAADYNARQAQAQRAWEEYMSNTQYQRAVKDMVAAGLNPILAASNGISGAFVGSGAAASIGAADTYQAQTFADQNSASHAEGYSREGSNGSSWENSESGLATGLSLLGESISGALSGLQSANSVNVTIDNLMKEGKKVPKAIANTGKQLNKAAKGAAKGIINKVKGAVKKGRKAAMKAADRTKYNGSYIEYSRKK